MKKLKIESGMRFNRLVIITETAKTNTIRRFICKCDCGNERVIQLDKLRNGKTKSCGCLKIEQDKERTIHGLHETRIYSIYTNMVTRCNNNKTDGYERYGGRGIKCEWKTFLQFYKDMGESYEKHLLKFGIKNTTIDRINNGGNYCKENCRWATMSEQNINRDKFVQKGSLLNKCNELGLNYKKVQQRINKLGWTEEKALQLK